MTAATPVRFAIAADLTRLPPDMRAEIIDGEIVEKASPLPEHGIAQLVLGAQLVNAFHRRAGEGPPGGWWLMTEVEVEYEPHQVYRHDLVGWEQQNPHRAPLHPRWIPRRAHRR